LTEFIEYKIEQSSSMMVTDPDKFGINRMCQTEILFYKACLKRSKKEQLNRLRKCIQDAYVDVMEKVECLPGQMHIEVCDALKLYDMDAEQWIDTYGS
jgi:hypothetical protein